jgi:hypothetical protein
MKVHLVVLKAFAGFRRGDLITDSAAIMKIQASPQAGFVVRVSAKEA